MGKRRIISSGDVDQSSSCVSTSEEDRPVWKDGWCKIPAKPTREYLWAIHDDLMMHWLPKDDVLFVVTWISQHFGLGWILDILLCSSLMSMAFTFWQRGFAIGCMLTVLTYILDTVHFMLGHMILHLRFFVGADETKGVRKMFKPLEYVGYIHHYLPILGPKVWMRLDSRKSGRFTVLNHYTFVFFFILAYYFDRLPEALAVVPFLIFWALMDQLGHEFYHSPVKASKGKFPMLSRRDHIGFCLPILNLFSAVGFLRFSHSWHHDHDPISTKPHAIAELNEMWIPTWIENLLHKFTDMVLMTYSKEDEGMACMQRVLPIYYVYKHIQPAMTFWIWNLFLNKSLSTDVASTCFFVVKVFFAQVVYETLISFLIKTMRYTRIFRVTYCSVTFY